MTSSLETCHALVLNADYRPLSYFPLSLWPWHESIKAVFMERVSIVSEYDREIRSPSLAVKLPSVVALKRYVSPSRRPASRDLTFFSVTGFFVSIVVHGMI